MPKYIRTATTACTLEGTSAGHPRKLVWKKAKNLLKQCLIQKVCFIVTNRHSKFSNICFHLLAESQTSPLNTHSFAYVALWICIEILKTYSLIHLIFN